MRSFFVIIAALFVWSSSPRAHGQPQPDASRQSESRQQETPSVLLPGTYWEERAPLQAGDAAPNWKLPIAPDSPLAKKGVSEIDFAKWRGEKTTVLVFLAFWCDTWKDVMRFSGEVRGDLDKGGTKLLAVAVDASQQPVARPAWQSGKLFFPVAIDAKSQITAKYGVRRVPTILIIGPDGKVRAIWEGLPGKKAFLKALRR